jgi:hypothetical protein
MAQVTKVINICNFRWALLFVVCLLLIITFSFNSRNPATEGFELRQMNHFPNPATGRHVEKPQALPDPLLEEIDESNPEIIEAMRELRNMEIARTRLCRQYEDENNYYYDFVIERATKEQQRKVMNLCLSVRGMTLDWFDGRKISWSQKLFDEFLLPAEYEFYIVSVSWRKSRAGGDYTIGGVEKDQLGYDNNGSPTSLDGRFNIIKMGKPFEADENWRFAHLLELTE